jgi:hypothetical protein
MQHARNTFGEVGDEPVGVVRTESRVHVLPLSDSQ